MSLGKAWQEFGPENMGYLDNAGGVQVSWQNGTQTWHFPSGSWPDASFALVSRSTIATVVGASYANQPLEPGLQLASALTIPPARNVYRVISTAQTDAWYLLLAGPSRLRWYAVSETGPGPSWVTAPAGAALGFQVLWPEGTGEPLTIPAGRFVRSREDAAISS